MISVLFLGYLISLFVTIVGYCVLNRCSEAYRGSSSLYALLLVLSVLLAVCTKFDSVLDASLVGLFRHVVVLDALSEVSFVVTCLAGSIVLVVMGVGFEYGSTVVLVCLGLFFMSCSRDLMMLYLGLELQSFGLYVLAAYNYESRLALEAGLKYFITGSVGSGILLIGCSLIYGELGSVRYNDIVDLLLFPVESLGVQLGLVCIVLGLFFKLGVAPLHMWQVDVLDGVGSLVGCLYSVVPKLGVLISIERVTINIGVVGLYNWFLVGGVMSLVVAGVGMYYSTRIRRFMAYSSIGHVGFMLLCMYMVKCSVLSLYGVVYYMVVYIVMNIGLWFIISQCNLVYVSDVGSVGRENGGIRDCVLVLSLSMAGIPPFAGFFAKLNVFTLLMDGQLLVLSLCICALSVLITFGYLRLVKVNYADTCSKEQCRCVSMDNSLAMIVSVSVVSLLCVV